MIATRGSSGLVEYLHSKADRLGSPFSGTFELTPVCNMSCNMCYVRKTPEEISQSGKRLRTVDEWLSIAKQAKEMGFTAVLVEGNPANYNSRGFVTSSDYGIVPGKDMHLPKVECLMVKELVPGALEKIHGVVDYSMYKTLSGEKKEIERD